MSWNQQPSPHSGVLEAEEQPPNSWAKLATVCNLSGEQAVTAAPPQAPRSLQILPQPCPVATLQRLAPQNLAFIGDTKLGEQGRISFFQFKSAQMRTLQS